MFKTSIKTEWKLLILAPSLRDHNRSLRAVNFSTELARLCAKMISWDLMHFCLRDAGTKLISDLGFLASQILGLFGGFSASRLLGLPGGFSTSRLQLTQFLFCQQVVPECLQWVYGLEPENNQYSGMAPSPCSGFAYCPNVANMVSLRSSCYQFLWGIVARNPFACAKVARTLRKIQDVWNLQGSRLHARINSMAYCHSKSMASIQNLVCLNWLYLGKPEGRHTKQTMQQGSNGTRHPSRLVPLCCVTIFVVYSFI